MIKSGKHRNLPAVLRQPRVSLHNGVIANRGNHEAPTDVSVLPAKSPPQQSQQQTSSLSTATNRDNLQFLHRSEIPEQCGASKRSAKGTMAVDPSCREKPPGVTLEEFKENSLPPSTVSVDPKLSSQASLHASVPDSSQASTFLPADTAEIMTPVQPVHINIHSVPLFQFVPQQIDLGAVASPLSSETVYENSVTPCLPEEQILSLHQINASEPGSDAESNQVPRIPSHDEHRSMSSSIKKISPKKTTATLPQFQCPRCLQRFDRVMAQLQHKCCPEKTVGGSLQNRPPLKLYKCLECCEEFSDLEAKIRHSCRAKNPSDKAPSEKTLTQSKIRKSGSKNKHRNQQSTSTGEKCGLEPNKKFANRHAEKRNNATISGKPSQTVVDDSKSSKPVYYKQFKCGLCSMKYRAIGYLKNHINSHLGSDEYKRSRLPYVCRTCKASFRYSKALKKHAAAKCQGQTKSDGPEQIGNPPSETIRESAKRGHSKDLNAAASRTASIQDNSSSLAPRSAVSRVQLQSQQSDQSSPRKSPHKCGFCGNIWDNATSLRKHVRSHWREIFERPSNHLMCSRCNEEFDNCVKFFLHLRRNGCTTASENTSQSDEGEPRDEVETHAAVHKPENSNSGRREAKAWQTRTKGKCSCPHCSLTFWRKEILDVHLQSSHPTLLDQSEFFVENSPKSNRNLEKHVEPAAECVVSTQASEPDSPTHQDTDENTESSMRTGIYPCRCNKCNLDFSSWNYLNDHRRTQHPLSVMNLMFGAIEQTGPDKSLEDASIDVMEDDFIHDCDLCGRVFRHWRFLALHKKAKHNVKFMFARYSSNKQPTHEATKEPSSCFTNQEMSTSSSDISSGEKVSNLGEETLDSSHISCSASVEAETYSEESSNMRKDSSSLPPCDISSLPLCDVLRQHPLSGIDTGSRGATSQEGQSLKLSDRAQPSNHEDFDLRCNSAPLSEPKLTVHDLKISLVVSLSDLSADSKQIKSQDEMNLPLPTGQRQQESRDAFNLLIDSVLGLESSGQQNILETVSLVGQSPDALSNYSLSHSEPGWHGTTKKITLSEAKDMLKVLNRNPVSNCYHCSVCGEWFEGIPQYISHVLAHCDMEKFRCTFCGQTDLNIFSMLNHVITTHVVPCELSELSEPNANQDQCPPTETELTGEQDTVDELDVIDLCDEVADLDARGNCDIPGPEANSPKSGYDYIFEPSRLENHLRPDAKTGFHECPLCPFRTKVKSGLIYHLRIHHELHPYRCRHCQQSFNFIPDVQVHFFLYHCHTRKACHPRAGQKQTGETSESQDPPDSTSLTQETYSSDTGYQSFVATSSGAPVSILQSPDKASGRVTTSTAIWMRPEEDSVPELDQTSDTNLEGGSPLVSEESQPVDKDGGKLLTAVKVERLSDDEAQSPNCIMDSTTPSLVKNERVTVKTEFPDECDYKAAEWVEHPDIDLSGLRDQGEEESQLGSASEMPCPVPNDAPPGSNSSNSSMSEILQENDHVDEPAHVVTVAELLTRLIKQNVDVSKLSVSKDCYKDLSKHKDVGNAKEKILPSSSHSANPGFEIRAADISNSNGLTGLCEVTEEPESACTYRGSDEALMKDSDDANVDAAPKDRATMDSPILNCNTAPGDKQNSSVQPLDDLFQLASDIGITVTGSQSEKHVSDENSDASQEGNPNDIPRVTDDENSVTDRVNGQEAEMASRERLRPSEALQTACDSFEQQECAPVEERRMKVDGDKNCESNVCIQEEHKNQTSPSFSCKRSLEDSSDSEDALKRQKFGLTKSQNSTEENNSAGVAPVIDGGRESTSSDLSITESSSGPILPPAKELTPDNLFHDINLGEDKIMSDTLKSLTKNSFTSRILKSFEKDSKEQASTKNTLDLDLINGPPYVSIGKRIITEIEVDKNNPLEKRCGPLSDLEPATEEDLSGMPKIFDVAGNGQMPVIPSGNKYSPPLTSSIQDVRFDREMATEDEDTIGGKTSGYASRVGPVMDARYFSTSDPRRPTADPCYPMNDGTSSTPDQIDERKNLLRAQLENSLTRLDEYLHQGRQQPHVHVPPNAGYLLDGASREALGLGGQEEVPHLSSQHTQQPTRRQSHLGGVNPMEGSWNQHQKPELESPQSTGPDHQYRCLPSSRVQESPHWSSQISTSFYPQNQIDSHYHQESNHDSHKRRYSPQEYRSEHLSTSEDHLGALRNVSEASMARLTGQTEATSTYRHQYTDSSGWCWTNSNQPELRSPAAYSGMHSQERVQGPQPNQTHNSNLWQPDSQGSNNRLRRSRSHDSQNHQLMSPPFPCRPETAYDHKRLSTKADRHLRQLLLRKQHSVLSTSSSAHLGSEYVYQRMGQPIESRENTETRPIDQPQQPAGYTGWQQRGYSREAWHPSGPPQDDASGGFPQIISVSSLHPRYLNRTNSV